MSLKVSNCLHGLELYYTYMYMYNYICSELVMYFSLSYVSLSAPTILYHCHL